MIFRVRLPPSNQVAHPWSASLAAPWSETSLAAHKACQPYLRVDFEGWEKKIPSPATNAISVATNAIGPVIQY